ncbi:MAG TPA: DinB family protein [Chitinophagaceae bacterium]|nr:DinB family protein [Chitinophagaceae bacterium]
MESLTQPGLFIKMVIAEWDKQNNNFNKFLSSITDQQLLNEIAPGKNTGIYLVGHLIAISDAMLPLLAFGEKLFPALENVFITKPDKSGLEMPSVAELKEKLKAVNAKLSQHIRSTSPEDWFKRHMAVSDEDFAKEPHRNKLNVVINRSNHMSYHLGQLILL